jgi:hypothetical protein
MTFAWSERGRRRLIFSVIVLVCLGAVIDDAITAGQLGTSRAENAELKHKLEAQATEQTSCLKDNINLITWKVNAQMLLMEASDDLSFCADHLPRRKFPPRRLQLEPDDSFNGSLPPQ